MYDGLGLPFFRFMLPLKSHIQRH